MAFESKMSDEKFSDFWRGLDTFSQITNNLELQFGCYPSKII